MRTRVVATLSAGAAAVVLVGWMGTSIYEGHRVESELKALQSAPRTPGSSLRMTALRHERGLFSSKGHAELRLEPGCDAVAGADEPVTLRVDYSVSHLPLPSSLARFEWQASPTGTTGDSFHQFFGNATQLSGLGVVTLNGALRTDMSLPELSVVRAGSAFQVAPSVGFLSVKDKQLGFGWKVPRVVVRGAGQAVELKDTAVDMDLQNRYLGTGVASFRVGQLSAGFGSVEGLSIKSEAKDDGDRLSVSVTPSVAKLQAAGQTLEALTLEIAVKGMDTVALETLTTTFSASCGLESLTADEGRRVRQAVTTLLTRGFSAGIGKLAGKSTDGAIDGHVMVELQPAKDGRIALAKQLRSSGQLDVIGNLLTREQRQLALDMGFALAQGEGLVRASYEYADGLLKVNGRAMDAGPIQVALAKVDLDIAGQLATRGDMSTSKQASVQPELVVAPQQEPSPSADSMVAAVPEAAVAQVPVAAECANVTTCVQQSLVAARTEDIDALRRIASRLDALPKPDLGNKVISRQLNTAALDALKRDDTATAIQQLRQALRENPRDVEVASNLGFALVKASQPEEAAQVLQAALVLDPRRTSTWTPLAEALALAGQAGDAQAALWAAYQWSGNREKSLAFYQDRAARETRASLQLLYARMSQITQAAEAQSATAR